MTTSLDTHTNQQNISPTMNNTLGNVYAFLVECRIERKVSTKVSDCEPFTLPPTKDTGTEANS